MNRHNEVNRRSRIPGSQTNTHIRVEMTTSKPRSLGASTSGLRKSHPIAFDTKKSRQLSEKRRATTPASIGMNFEFEPVNQIMHDTSSSFESNTGIDDSADDFQQLLRSIHKKYKNNSEKQERQFKEQLKQTVKKSVAEFQMHMDQFTAKMFLFHFLIQIGKRDWVCCEMNLMVSTWRDKKN